MILITIRHLVEKGLALPGQSPPVSGSPCRIEDKEGPACCCILPVTIFPQKNTPKLCFSAYICAVFYTQKA